MIKKSKIVNREYYFDLNANYVLVGLRRAGKSTLLSKVVQDLIASGTEWNQIIYINSEDERLSGFSLDDFNDIIAIQAELSEKKGWFFLDEIQNVDGWEKFARRLADSKEHKTLRSIGLGISKDAVIDYIGYAVEVFLIFAIRNYFSRFVDKETTPKYYFSDNGLLNLFLVNKEPRLLENLVAINLWNKHREHLYYLKSQSLDVDFFAEDTGEVIQVAYSIREISDERETRSLVQASKTIKDAKRFIIITYEEESELNIDGVKIAVIPIWKWLLEN